MGRIQGFAARGFDAKVTQHRQELEEKNAKAPGDGRLLGRAGAPRASEAFRDWLLARRLGMRGGRRSLQTEVFAVQTGRRSSSRRSFGPAPIMEDAAPRCAGCSGHAGNACAGHALLLQRAQRSKRWKPQAPTNKVDLEAERSETIDGERRPLIIGYAGTTYDQPLAMIRPAFPQKASPERCGSGPPTLRLEACMLRPLILCFYVTPCCFFVFCNLFMI